MKTLAAYSTPEEAHLVRSRLESAGIPSFLHSENSVQMYWLYSNAIGGVRLQVAEEDFEAAEEFLASEAPPPPDAAADVACPECGSTDTAPDQLPRRIALLSLLFLSFPFLLKTRRWRCASCDHVFKPVSPETPGV